MSNRDTAELHREIEQLRAELNHIATCSRNRDEENARLRSELAGVTAENKALQDQLDCACNPEELRIAREDMQRLQAALASVTAELDAARSELDAARGWIAGDSVRIGELRARVAEVEEQAERYRLVALRQDATIAELTTDGNAATLAANLAAVSQRNAELVAALEKIAKADPLENGRYAAFRASAALARAESAESKSHPNPSEIRTSESATPAKNAADTPKNREACAKIMAAWAAEDTPAKHPDADWLSVLDYATQALIRAIAKAGGEYKDTTFDDEWLCVSLAPPRRGDFQLGDLRRLVRSIAAIDAARKQGGAA